MSFHSHVRDFMFIKMNGLPSLAMSLWNESTRKEMSMMSMH